MSLACALFLLAQSAVPAAATQSDGEVANGTGIKGGAIKRGAPSARSGGARVQVQASARVLRAVRIDLPTLRAAKLPEDLSSKNGVQRGRDAEGTIWIEFS